VDLDTLLHWSEFAGNLIVAASSLGIVAAIVYAARSLWDRRRWRTFATLVEDWAEKDFRAGDDLPGDQWRVFAANWLAEAEFTPSECIKYLELAVLYAKARADFVLEQIAKE